MDRSQKENFISGLRQEFASQGLIVVTQQSGLSASETDQLRKGMLKAETNYKIAKNTLLRLVVSGTQYEGLASLFKGPTAIAYSLDSVAAAKAVMDFANKNNKLQVVGGSLGGQLLTAEQVKALASLPSLDELRGKLVGLLVAPHTKLAVLTQAPAAQIARVVGAYSKKS